MPSHVSGMLITCEDVSVGMSMIRPAGLYEWLSTYAIGAANRPLQHSAELQVVPAMVAR
jgi:hypothetical protein